MDLERNPFAFLAEEEDADTLIQNAKASAAASAFAAKEAALEEKQKEKKNERNTQRFSTKAKRIILPRHATRRDIIVRKEKLEEVADAQGGNKGNCQQNSVAEARRSNGDVKGIINKHNSYNGPVRNNFKGNNSNEVEGGLTGYSNGGRQGPYRKGFYGYANNGGRGKKQGFSGNGSNVGNQKLEKKVEQVSNGVEKNEEEDGWIKVEKRRSKGRRSGSYESSHVSTVSEKDTSLEDVQEVSNPENTASEKDTTGEDVQEVNNASEKDLGGEVNAENNVAEAVNGENKSNDAEIQKSTATGSRTTENGSQKRKNKNKNFEAAQNLHQKKEETNHSQKMTLGEYEKSLLEKRKALNSLKKTENTRVIQLKDFESMVHLAKKTDPVSTNEDSKDSHNYKKNSHKEEEKDHKGVSMVELGKKCGLTFNHRPQKPYGARRGGYHVGESDKEPLKGSNSAAPESEKQRNKGHQKAGASPPIFKNLELFPKLGGKAA